MKISESSLKLTEPKFLPIDYPPHEPVSDFARDYKEYLLNKAAGIGGAEDNYSPDP